MFYVQGETLMAAPVSTNNGNFSAATARPLFEAEGAFDCRGHRYNVSSDRQRFVIVETLRETRSSIRVVQNWYEEFRDREQD